MIAPFTFPEVVEADGLRLRLPRPADAPAVLRALGDEASRRFLPATPTQLTSEYAEFWCAGGVERIRAAGGIRYAVVNLTSDEFLAAVTLQRIVSDRAQGEIGYWVAPWARGKGLAARVVRVLARAAFEAGLARIELCVEWENVASQKVALAAGFRREGVRRSALQYQRDGGIVRADVIAYARLASDSGEPVPRGLPDLPGGELTDGVVTLRPIGPADADDLVALFQFPEVAAGNVGSATRAGLAQKCTRNAALWLAGDGADMAILDAATGAFAGDIGFWYTMRPLQEGMIGYSLRPEFRGRGLATRAVDLIARWAFEQVGVARLVAGTDPANVASQRVLQRAGFEREAFMRGRLPGENGERIDDIQWVRFP